MFSIYSPDGVNVAKIMLEQADDIVFIGRRQLCHFYHKKENHSNKRKGINDKLRAVYENMSLVAEVFEAR